MRDDLKELRYRVCEVNYLSQEGHLASSLSCLDLLNVIVPKTLGHKDHVDNSEHRGNRFILSKGHAALGYYAVLEHYGWISSDQLDAMGSATSILGGHPDSTKLNSAYISTGSLGHGLPIGVGAALDLKNRQSLNKVYVLCGDGEFMEGSMWESVIIATKLKLSNLVVLIDFNSTHMEIQLTAEQMLGMFRNLGWSTNIINGHSDFEIHSALNALSNESPSLIIAMTNLGHNIPALIGRKEWHRKNLTKDMLDQIRCELGI